MLTVTPRVAPARCLQLPARCLQSRIDTLYAITLSVKTLPDCYSGVGRVDGGKRGWGCCGLLGRRVDDSKRNSYHRQLSTLARIFS